MPEYDKDVLNVVTAPPKSAVVSDKLGMNEQI